MKVGGLFSGLGGWELGLERAGFDIAWHCEADPYCQRVLERHWPGVPCYPDVCQLRGADVEPIDVLCGGFPCQDLSYAGNGAGLDGARSGLWSEYARLVDELRPRYVLVENVSALLGRGLGTVLRDLAAVGYDAEWDCIPASAVGAPHRRDRLWIVAYPGASGRSGSPEPHGPAAERERPTQLGDDTHRRADPERRPPDASDRGLADADGSRLEGRGRGLGEPPAGRSAQGGERQDLAGCGGAWWATEPAVRGVLDGLSEGLDGGVGAGQGVGPEGDPRSDLGAVLRGLWRHLAARPSSLRRRSDEQLACELADALSGVSHPLALGEREGAVAASLAYLRGVRQGCEALGALRNASDSLAQAWLALSAEDQAWVELAMGGGRWAAEWPGVARVSAAVPNRVDRLRGLGNALVPQIAEWIGRRILEHEGAAGRAV